MQPSTPGVLEVITGPMFSGKSEELIRRLKRARIARQRVACYKPDIDLRYHRAAIASHSSQTHEAVPIASVEELRAILYPQLDEIEVVGIDEVQFLSPEIIPVALDLVALGKRVLLAGLDTTFANEPFGPVPNLMALADRVRRAVRRLHGLRPGRHPHPAPRRLPGTRRRRRRRPLRSPLPRPLHTAPRRPGLRAARISRAVSSLTVSPSEVLLDSSNLSRNDRKIYRLFLLQLLRGASITPSPARRAFLPNS